MGSNPKKGRIYSQEFKLEAVALAEKTSFEKACKELDVASSTLRAWAKEIKLTGDVKKGEPTYAELKKEINRLKKENMYLEEINKVLKKSTAIFSSDQIKGSK